MKCVRCGGENCTEIVIHPREEEMVEFFSCRKCEAKWWQREGAVVDLEAVLSIAAQPRRNW